MNAVRRMSAILLFVPLVSAGQISKDAIELTLREQEGIELDSARAKEFDRMLTIARSVHDTLVNINAFPTFVPNHLLVKSEAPWTEPWKSGQLWTGNPYIDSLGRRYGLTEVEGNRLLWYKLTFDRPMVTSRLAELYKKDTSVAYAERNGYCCDGNDIEYFRKNGVDHFIFSRGWGDCPAGCGMHHYWYVTVMMDQPVPTAALLEDRLQSGPVIYRWNIPGRFAMTMFPSVDSILSAVRFHPEWWVRKHAIEGIRRFFKHNDPWVGEDRTALWHTLQSHIRLRKEEVLSVLRSARTDNDIEVRSSAETAVTELSGLSVKEPPVSLFFDIPRNYPNPFNGETVITFTLKERSFVTVTIHSMLGQLLETLHAGEAPSGRAEFRWRPLSRSSGIYFFRVTAGTDSRARSMLYLK